MKLILNLTLKFLINLFISIFIFTFFTFIIWFRYIRERLPRDIPFNLSLIGFIIIICVCLGYIYTIYKHINPSKDNNTFTLIGEVKKYLYKPLELMIDFLQHNKVTKEKFGKLFVLAIENAAKINYLKLYILIDILPRAILLSVFIIDIFYFSSIKHFYKILIIGIIIIIGKSIIHVYRHIMKTNIDAVDERAEIWCDDFVANEPMSIITAKEYVPAQAMRILNNLEPLEYFVSLTIDYIKRFKKQLGIPPESRVNLDSNRSLMRGCLNLSVLLYRITYLYDQIVIKFKYVNILISFLYVICWVYILIVSFHTLDLTIIEEISKDINEPFSS
jgi:hypothetical protein